MKLRLFFTLLLLICFIFVNRSYSQENTEEETKEKPKTEEESIWDEFDEEDEFDDEEDDEWDYLGNMRFRTGSASISYSVDHPTIEVCYGIMDPSIHKDEFAGDFARIGAIELHLGYTTISDISTNENICEYDYDYLFIGNVSEEISIDESDNGIGTDVWRFGIATSDGYGYKLAEGYNVILYHTNGAMWSKLNFRGEAPDEKSQTAIDVYGNAVRFGSMYESGMKIHLFDYVALSGSYERSMVYPRHMFWYWVASEAVSGIGHGLVDMFIDDIIEASPYAGPIAYFVLNTGISYGMYELQKKDMNWPIDTHSPFFNEGFKVSFSFIF